MTRPVTVGKKAFVDKKLDILISKCTKEYPDDFEREERALGKYIYNNQHKLSRESLLKVSKWLMSARWHDVLIGYYIGEMHKYLRGSMMLSTGLQNTNDHSLHARYRGKYIRLYFQCHTNEVYGAEFWNMDGTNTRRVKRKSGSIADFYRKLNRCIDTGVVDDKDEMEEHFYNRYSFEEVKDIDKKSIEEWMDRVSAELERVDSADQLPQAKEIY